ncbi:MAG: hypothetical protein UEP57_00195 [Oscillospiraceae bacterium]|nr:hypothetical protein [Oscillospiraceae bacterium]
MSEMEEKLSAILNNPQMMQQIMSMAQVMGNSQQTQQTQPPQQSPQPRQEAPGSQESILPALANLDPRMLQNIMGMARQGGVDQNQQALLRALSPYLSRDRINKLERAMRAARMAGLASAFLNSGGLQLLSGR